MWMFCGRILWGSSFHIKLQYPKKLIHRVCKSKGRYKRGQKKNPRIVSDCNRGGSTWNWYRRQRRRRRRPRRRSLFSLPFLFYPTKMPSLRPNLGKMISLISLKKSVKWTVYSVYFRFPSYMIAKIFKESTQE